jgi:hypothetical protein
MDQDSKLCTNCGYDLRGLDRARCPECGVPFNPHIARPVRRLRPSLVLWLRIVGPPLVFLGTVITLVVLYETRAAPLHRFLNRWHFEVGAGLVGLLLTVGLLNAISLSRQLRAIGPPGRWTALSSTIAAIVIYAIQLWCCYFGILVLLDATRH